MLFFGVTNTLLEKVRHTTSSKWKRRLQEKIHRGQIGHHSSIVDILDQVYSWKCVCPQFSTCYCTCNHEIHIVKKISLMRALRNWAISKSVTIPRQCGLIVVTLCQQGLATSDSGNSPEQDKSRPLRSLENEKLDLSCAGLVSYLTRLSSEELSHPMGSW